MPYFGEPVGRVKIQTTSKNSQRYYTTKRLIRDLLSNTSNCYVRGGELREYLFTGECVACRTGVIFAYLREQGRKRGEREARVACVGRFAKNPACRHTIVQALPPPDTP